MNQTVFLTLFVLAVVATVMVVRLGMAGTFAGRSVDNTVGVVLSACCFALWGVVAVNAFEVTIISDGVEHVTEYRELVWLSVGGAALALYSMLSAAIQEIRAQGGV